MATEQNRTEHLEDGDRGQQLLQGDVTIVAAQEH